MDNKQTFYINNDGKLVINHNHGETINKDTTRILLKGEFTCDARTMTIIQSIISDEIVVFGCDCKNWAGNFMYHGKIDELESKFKELEDRFKVAEEVCFESANKLRSALHRIENLSFFRRLFLWKATIKEIYDEIRKNT